MRRPLRYRGRMSAAERTRRFASQGLRHARRVIVAVVGVTVLVIGIAMIVLPGPAVVVIPIGLGILATEFVWAQRLLHNLKERGSRLVNRKRSEGERES